MKNIKTYEKFNIEKFKERSNKFFNPPYDDDPVALKLIEYVSTHNFEINQGYDTYSFSIRMNEMEGDPFGEEFADGNILVEVKLMEAHILGNSYALILNRDKLDVGNKIIGKLYYLLQDKFYKKREDDKKNRINKYKEDLGKI